MGTPIKMSDFDFDNKKLQPKEVEPLPVNYNVDSPFKAGVVPEVKPNTGTQAMNDALGGSWLLSPEEVAKRQRRADTAAMIGNLGNVMSAFSNLYYVNKGAPSQQVPKAVIPDYMTLQDRVTQARQAALNNELARKRIINEERKQTRLEEDQRLRFRKQDWIEKYQAGLLDLKAEANRINEEYKQGQIGIQERNAASRELNAIAAMIRANASSQTAAANASYKNWQMQPEYLEKEYDVYGNVTSQTKGRGGGQQVVPTNGASQQGGKGKGYGTRNNGGKGRGY